MIKHLRHALLACLAGLAVHSLAQAQAPSSGTTVKIVVPFTPGTGMDTIARTVAPRLAERLGRPVIVENTPGASGNIGADRVAKSAADGNTVLMGANTLLIAAQLYKNVAYDPVKDFSALSLPLATKPCATCTGRKPTFSSPLSRSCV